MLILCFKIFLSRILDVSLSSVRTMFVVKCNKIMASLIAFVEIFIWFYAAKEALFPIALLFVLLYLMLLDMQQVRLLERLSTKSL